MTTYNDKILVPNAAKDGLDTVHPETNTGNVYDFKNNGWLSETFENVQNELTTHLEDDNRHVTQAKQDIWDGIIKAEQLNTNILNWANDNRYNTVGFVLGSGFQPTDTPMVATEYFLSLEVDDSGARKKVTFKRYGGGNEIYTRNIFSGNWNSDWLKVLNQHDYDQLFTSASNGKATIANAIRLQGVPTADDAEFATMANNISQINGAKTGYGTITQSGGYGYINVSGLGFTPNSILIRIMPSHGASDGRCMHYVQWNGETVCDVFLRSDTTGTWGLYASNFSKNTDGFSIGIGNGQLQGTFQYIAYK